MDLMAINMSLLRSENFGLELSRAIAGYELFEALRRFDLRRRRAASFSGAVTSTGVVC